MRYMFIVSGSESFAESGPPPAALVATAPRPDSHGIPSPRAVADPVPPQCTTPVASAPPTPIPQRHLHAPPAPRRRPHRQDAADRQSRRVIPADHFFTFNGSLTSSKRANSMFQSSPLTLPTSS